MNTQGEICAECEKKEVEQGKFSGTLLLKKVTAENLARVFARCVDGRYLLKDSKEALLAVPGADAGIFAVVWTVLKNLLKKQALDIKEEDVIRGYMLVRGGESNLRFHIDDHDHSDDNSQNPLKGCGYMGVLHSSAEKFNFDNNDIILIDQFVEQAKAGGAEVIKLQGDHKEEAIVVVSNSGINVLNITQEGKQVFVYNRALLEQFFQVFWPELINNLKLEGLEAKDLIAQSMKIMDEHVDTTMKLLGASDKPHISIE